ncbi:hypothetical protein H6F93_22540 [Leptolyngbya sp. FACHB-671]|uniref:hypothetical protein n=1 Tax=Leptolyngbya sp. FACHB-671 TaxID=2692812 RepID=UPI0016891CFE|nr:hypothetical protein [Leptolyngbya sp. FACHB-671]MBD2070255.1 hypothetical protein [Leptolyngbya sp. FACHB-671]
MKDIHQSDCCDRSSSYQQALCDFNVAQLMEGLSNFSDLDFDPTLMHLTPEEVESLAALLIHQLTLSLQGTLVAGYLNVLRNGDTEAIAQLPPLDLKPLQSPVKLPENFPHQVTTPLFVYGDAVRWIPLPSHTQTNTGIVIGRFYAYARHLGSWTWKYLVWLKEPCGCTLADTAWEDDLEANDEEENP